MDTELGGFGRIVAGLAVAVLVGCGGGGYGGDGGAPPAASVTITVDPTTITLGESATITWSTNGTTCTADGAWSGAKASSGSETVTPAMAGTFTYLLTCTGGAYGQSQQYSATLTVNPVTGFTSTPLVSGFAGTAALTTDANLTNPRGIAFAPNTPAQVLGSRMSSAYDGNGKIVAPKLLARIAGAGANPTAIVANTTSGFIIAGSGVSGPAEFIYASKSGAIGGWSKAVDRGNAAVLFADRGGAVYMGVALASTGSGNFLYATDFRNNKIDVFDASFIRQTPSSARFAFADPTLPAGYAPFGIQALQNRAARATQIFVTYARQLEPDRSDPAIGAGLGLMNVFDTNGNLLRRLVPEGAALNAPWGIALAPADFGTLSRALLIGNHGDGKINAYDPVNGTFRGTVSDTDAKPIVSRGLWGIAFGNDSNDQPHNTLFFTAGTDEADGAYGRIDVGAMPFMSGATTHGE
jgi:uncharacterized protein (TIGR03118 family)